ncbi:TRAP transporter, DctM subunit [Cohaesibacter marisflavi]|uniref:TRAP transporter large permease protein n=1 Tax=Cohaesibacter marisflavi TaxID=655353 RepID=A0A1I5EZI7_9HYPH|nr:TRAP transporter large permease subunit [Cohaesibacter marisflavi]SFO16800.1 TRAP transporter, DctM subunit [Cohaesibacter marisflavi]
MPASVILPLVLLVVILGSGVWIGLGLAGIGLISLEVFRNVPVDKLFSQSIWNGLSSAELLALPLFILMAELIYRSKFIDGVFGALEPWLRNLPGGLLHTNIIGCALFALISGSSAATTSSIGRITVGELRQRGYDERMTIGTLAGAGTLGFLIPPSIVMIIYGVLSRTSVLKLFAAGIIPGIFLCVAFMGYVAIVTKLNPGMVGKAEPMSKPDLWRARFKQLPLLLPFLLLIAAVLGSMYGGLASPTEAAAFAVVATVVIMAFERSLTIANLKDAAIGTSRTVSMLGLIVAAASFLSVAMGFLAIPTTISRIVTQMDLAPFALILLLIVIYMILGTFLEGMSMIVMTIPIVLPLVQSAGYDKIWFGIFLVIMVELAQISPPVGMNLFVLQGITKKPLGEVVKAALPFFLIMMAFVLLLALFPQIISFLPNLVMA